MQAAHQHDAAWLRLLLELKQMPQEWLHLNGLEDSSLDPNPCFDHNGGYSVFP